MIFSFGSRVVRLKRELTPNFKQSSLGSTHTADIAPLTAALSFAKESDMRIRRIMTASVLMVGILCCCYATTYAQGTNLGTIRGTVTDANGAVVTNAAIQVTDQATGISRDVTTNSAGDYEVPALKPGTYKVTVTATGFKTTNMDAVVSGSDVVRADLKLEVGAATESVIVVGGEAGLIEKDQPVIAQTLNNQQLTQVPRDSREILEFLYLNPDITQGPGGDGTFKFIGAQSYGATFSLDGQRTNGGIFGEPTSSQPSLETIGELIVLSKNFSAEYSGISNIRIETKRGGSSYHGSLFYNNKNSALAAWTTQDKIDKSNFLPTPALSSFPTPYFNLNETGGSIGGPVPFTHKNTFFLLAYERRWDFAPVRVRASNIPTSLILGGNFTAINAGNRPAVPSSIVPLLTPAEIANNTILTGEDCDVAPEDCTLRWNSIPTR
ncbi:MAG TPA: carboxypeptidase-like regulatory domain-containing protein, partial [Pyrinomonadaceae bacterium]|nr:carboxypeptidase-like regulatory domain-containing protein [Pyrinomonadaceae bacterium]